MTFLTSLLLCCCLSRSSLLRSRSINKKGLWERCVRFLSKLRILTNASASKMILSSVETITNPSSAVVPIILCVRKDAHLCDAHWKAEYNSDMHSRSAQSDNHPCSGQG